MPIFAEILSVIDKNYNLNLIHGEPDQFSLIARLWLGIFANNQICRFSYSDIVTKGQQQKEHDRVRVPGIGKLLASSEYKCRFPFSWIIRDVINSQWNAAAALAGKLICNVVLLCIENIKCLCVAIFKHFVFVTMSLWSNFVPWQIINKYLLQNINVYTRLWSQKLYNNNGNDLLSFD